MEKKFNGTNTTCVHAGELEDKQFKGAVSPLFMATSYAFDEVEEKRYPRNFNTPNQVALAKKMAALENTEAALLFGSGMAAVSTALLGFLEKGDHVVFQKTLYGGTSNFILEEFEKFGIFYSFTKDLKITSFEEKIQENTKVIYIETPSNPLLTVTDIEAVANLAKHKGLVSMIDNTFATPINQQPIALGIDVVIHSATKYMGGHSDILAGAVMASEKNIQKIFSIGRNLGGNLSDYTVWLLERSLKTLALRVNAQSQNAQKMAAYLSQSKYIDKVYYPGLSSHPDHKIAKKQMTGFGGMLSFELVKDLNPKEFMKGLQLIKPSMSLAGVESTILSPAETSHALLTAEQRKDQGIKDGLLRFSVGIEEVEDLITDIEQAINRIL
ncbi:trans-sulfuration enzyme family protein [Zunongwangia sp.]|uniref:trans-sulfuration enzyme family protein n=1 Tax=Zunongwangia sp. TaxID=1965325 RepID=UPI003AA839BA